jgi:hypothetical protein
VRCRTGSCCGRRRPSAHGLDRGVDDEFANRLGYRFLRSSPITTELQMMNRGGGEPSTDMALEPRSRMDPPPRSFAADAYDCIKVPIRPDRPNTSLRRDRSRHRRAPLGLSLSDVPATADVRAVSRKARLAVHRPSACSGVKALRNTSCVRRQSRQAPLAFRSLDAFRALRESRSQATRRRTAFPAPNKERAAKPKGTTNRMVRAPLET